jgi:hypothetical protein
MQLKSKTTPTLQALTEVLAYKNSEVVRYYAGMNMRSAMEAGTPSIGILAKTDEETVKRCITNLFIGTSMYFDSVLPESKAIVISEELLAKYETRQLKLEDILAICIEIKEADIYKLTLARILKHVAVYVQQREQLAIQRSITNSQNHKSDLGESNIDKRIMNSIRHIERSNEEVAKGRVRVQKYYK